MAKKTSLLKKQSRFGYLFISPYLLGLSVFIIIPLIESIRISFSELTVGTVRYELTGTGFENYSYIFTVDPNFRQYLLTSLKEMITAVPIVILFSFFMASILTVEFRGRGFVRTVMFLPVIITSGAVDQLISKDYLAGTVTDTVSSKGGELANSVLSMFGEVNLSDALIGYISDAIEGIYDITVMSAVPIVIFIAALNSISSSVFEAAYIEGATKWEVFWKIKFPISSPQILTCVVYCLIDNLNDASNPVIAAIKSTTYDQWKYGRGAAMSLSYMLIIFVILLLVYRIIAKRIAYIE